jgi:hypothetical protein
VSARRGRRWARRGSATVETAILMVVLVPLVMYTLFLEDLLYYKLEMEEVVMSGPWDVLQLDYRHGSQGKGSQGDLQKLMKASQQLVRQTYWDHSSAYNTYADPGFDGTDQRHHVALTAHQCWLAQGGEQLTCTWDQQVGVGDETDATFSKYLQGAGGKKLSCSARLGVQNYFLPTKFMNFWAQQDVTDQQVHVAAGDMSNIHAEAAGDPYVFPRETFSVVHDPWALDWVKNNGGGTAQKHDPVNAANHPGDRSSELEQWVQAGYQANVSTDKAMPSGGGQSNDFLSAAVDKELLKGPKDSSPAAMDGMGDDLTTAPVSWDPAPDHEFSGAYASGWSDQRVQDTENARQKSYFGVADTSW